jgi:nonribosomal peptide synthetase DhbF
MFPGTIEDMAADYLSLIREVQPVGPYNLLGWSLGGLVAYAIATQLQSAGQEVAMLALLDSFPSERQSPPDSRHGEHDKEPVFVEADDNPTRKMLDALRQEGHILSEIEQHHYDAIKDGYRKSGPLMWTFTPKRFHGEVLLFVATQDGVKPPIETWIPFVDGQIEVHRIETSHGAMMDPLPAAKIGSVLAGKIARQGTFPNCTSKEQKRGY